MNCQIVASDSHQQIICLSVKCERIVQCIKRPSVMVNQCPLLMVPQWSIMWRFVTFL